ncbi:MAG TPA: DUF1549 domain-containing protein [Planctomycetaceae bacterium]|nr:DUF1549 domain-containing protein [Planctomycetaceae bacterium]
MSADTKARFKAYALLVLVIIAVTAVVASAARSPVDWRTIDPHAATHPGTRTSGPATQDFSGTPPAEIQSAVAQVDRFFEQNWHEAAIKPAPRASDLQIMRRLSLALCGTIPSLEEIRIFESDHSPSRLDRWTARLLSDNRFADYFAERLARSFVGTDIGQVVVFRRDRFVDWLRQQLSQNTPYDQVARHVVSETGLWTDHPATNFITSAIADGELDENKLAGRTVRAFLGQRMDCAQCHDHPFAEWKQAQFEGLAALFGQTHSSLVGVEDKAKMKYEVQDRKTLKKRVVEPAVPFHPEWLPTTGTRRERLAAWITHPQNRRFERATANRIWGLLFGRPLHRPVDDLPDPPTDDSRDVLDLIGADFREHHYDLRHMIRVIVASRPFQVDSAQEEASPPKNATEDANWSVFPMTRLRPEQLIGSILQSTSPRTIDQNSHLFVRAKRFFQENEFVKQYGDLGDNELDERSGTIAQALLRMNGKLASDALRAKDMSASSRITSFAGTDEACVEACYLVALSRRPTKAENDYFVPQFACAEKSGPKDARGQVVEDIFWSLFNSPEFSWNH